MKGAVLPHCSLLEVFLTLTQRLAEVFEKGFRDAGRSLSDDEYALYLIQDFILEYENGGLSGYLYNRLPDLELIQSTINAMKRFGLHSVANLLQNVLELFQGYQEPESVLTWRELKKIYDPENRLNQIVKLIDQLKNYGLDDLTS